MFPIQYLKWLWHVYLQKGSHRKPKVFLHGNLLQSVKRLEKEITEPRATNKVLNSYHVYCQQAGVKSESCCPPRFVPSYSSRSALPTLSFALSLPCHSLRGRVYFFPHETKRDFGLPGRKECNESDVTLLAFTLYCTLPLISGPLQMAVF